MPADRDFAFGKRFVKPPMKTQLLLAICCISLAASSQNFRRTYGWGAYNTAPAFTQSPAGGFALLGSFSSPTSYQTDFVLMRTDTAGVFQWAKAYGGSGVDEARDLLQLPDSGWLLVGFTNSFSPNNDYNGYVIRLTANGDTVWTRQIGSSSWDFLYDVKWAPNGNFLLSGATNNSPNGKTAGWLVEVSPAGTIIHQYFYENSGNVFFSTLGHRLQRRHLLSRIYRRSNFLNKKRISGKV